MNDTFTFDNSMISKRTEKVCNICGNTKSIDEFHKHSGSRDNHRNDCKDCRSKFKDKSVIKILPEKIICGVCGNAYPRTNEFFNGNLNNCKANRKCKSCIKAYRRNKHFIDSYSINTDEYNELLKEQDGKCYLCGSSYKLVVDHDHKTNKIRKLLCDSCNRAIGFFREDILTMQKAINYINEFQ